MIHHYVLMLGSNDINASHIITLAQQALSTIPFYIDKVSKALKSPDYTGLSADYTNVVVSGTSPLSIERLHDKLKSIELELGRCNDKSIKSCILIDIDIVIANGEVVKTTEYSSPPFRHLFETL